MQFGWALLGSSTQISSLSPEVAGVWPRMDGEGDKTWRRSGERREERQGGEETRQERSDEVLKLRESCYQGVQSCDEMWQ